MLSDCWKFLLHDAVLMQTDRNAFKHMDNKIPEFGAEFRQVTS